MEKHNLRTIRHFVTLKAYKFSSAHWRIIDCTHGSETDPYKHFIGPVLETLESCNEYAYRHYTAQYP